ncbi:hypothetical protein BB560_002580 [Smittium megazygosporum]|uniref:Core-binding (CB) domain-containing protein n=1 Tax=Smittium megazygosporum TaxID=133381 RepID=A0A2T9ZEC7_9FUNG|nr:hypothetical protein BB560_002580 [Smittium megazygosporum]
MGTEHSGAGIQKPIPNKKCNKLYKAAESKSAPKNLEHLAINNAPVPLQEEDDQGSKRPTNNGGSITTIKEGNRRGKDKNTRFLQPAFHYPKEDWWAQADSRLAELEQTCSGETLQDEIIEDNLRTYQEERLHDLPRFRRCLYAYSNSEELQKIPALSMEWKRVPIQSTSIWTIPESVYIYKSPSTNINMGKNTGNTISSIFGRSADIRRNKEYMYQEYRNNTQENGRIGVQNQIREISNKAITINKASRNDDQFKGNELEGSIIENKRPQKRSLKITQRREDYYQELSQIYWEGSGYVSGFASRSSIVTPTLRVKEPSSSSIEVMDFDSIPYKASSPEFKILEGQAQGMEWPLLARDTGNGGFYGRQRQVLGNSDEFSLLFRLLEYIRGVNAHQFKRIVDYIVCAKASTSSGTIGSDLFRQYYKLSIRKEIWRNKFFNASTHSRRDLVSLFEHKYSSSDNIYPLHLKPCRRTKQVNGSDRMVTFETNIPETRKNLWATRCGSVCVSSKQTGQQLIQLVQKSESSGNECFTTKSVPVEKSILLPPMESYSRGCSQGKKKTNNYNISRANVENGNLVSRPDKSFNITTITTSSIISSTRPKKRKISAREKQELTEGLENYAIDLILSNKRRIRRRTRYISIQQRFLDWRDLSNIVGPITTPQIVNFLSSLYVKEKLNKSTILSYKSAILRLTSDYKRISNDTILKEFILAINDSSIKSFVKPTINITPVIEQLKIWGPSETLSDKDLTSKLCWLLAVTGLLRASDIHRIDDSETKIKNRVLNLVIVAPKEKRNGQPIKRPCQISGHLNPILCPVKTYQVYKTRIATKECLIQHVNDDSLTINSLVRYINNYNKPLSVNSITRYIHNLSKLLEKPENTTIPKGRAIGATLASKSGVSSNEIVTQGFWSSYSMFDNFYRFSRESNNNLTESVLSLKGENCRVDTNASENQYFPLKSAVILLTKTTTVVEQRLYQILREKYNAVQTRFLEWRDRNIINNQMISAFNIISHLTWSSEPITSDTTFKTYSKEIKETPVNNFDSPSLNILLSTEKPILSSPNKKPKTEPSKQKVDENQTLVIKDFINLIVVKSKEMPEVQPIKKVRIIHKHQNPLLYPTQVFKGPKARVLFDELETSNNDNDNKTPQLICNCTSFSKDLTPNKSEKYIKSNIYQIQLVEGKKSSKFRSIGFILDTVSAESPRNCDDSGFPINTDSNSATTIPTDIPTTIPTGISTTIPTDISTTIPTDISTTISTDISTTISTDISTTISTDISTTISTDISTTIPTDISTTIPTEISTIIPATIATTISATILTTVTQFKTIPTTLYETISSSGLSAVTVTITESKNSSSSENQVVSSNMSVKSLKSNKNYGENDKINIPCSGDFTLSLTSNSRDSDLFFGFADANGITENGKYIELQIGLKNGQNAFKDLAGNQVKRNNLDKRQGSAKINLVYVNGIYSLLSNGQSFTTFKGSNIIPKSLTITPLDGTVTLSKFVLTCM